MSNNTSIYACPKCGDPNTQDLYNGFWHCRECCTIFPAESKPPTVFHRLTTSPEVLALHLVYGDKEGYFYSTIIEGERFLTIVKAIAATVAKLKGV